MFRTLLSTLKFVAVATVSALLLSACVPLLGPPRGPAPVPVPVPLLPPVPLPLVPLVAPPVPGP